MYLFPAPIQYLLSLFLLAALQFTTNFNNRMKRSASFVQPRFTFQPKPVVEDRPQANYDKFIYINTEEANKEKHTIFHSPYKGGKKNSQYSNPSFMSSDVFYPKEYVANEHSKSKPKLGLIPTKNDVVYQEQYKSRMMRKSYSNTCLNKGLKSNKSMKFLESVDQNVERSLEKDRSLVRINSRILRKIEDSKLLRHQIDLLKRSPPRQTDFPSQKQNPVYLENRSIHYNRMLKKETSKLELLGQMNKALKRKQEERWSKEYQKKNDKAMIDRASKKFYGGIKNSNEFQKQRAKLLSELLLEQILQKS